MEPGLTVTLLLTIRLAWQIFSATLLSGFLTKPLRLPWLMYYKAKTCKDISSVSRVLVSTVLIYDRNDFNPGR